MNTYIDIERKCAEELPNEFRQDDVRFPEQFVERLITEYTEVGDTVFDPFAGFGTVLRVAESMGRKGYGVESDEERAAYIQSTLSHPGNLITGDSRKLISYSLPAMDLVITSPPYPVANSRLFCGVLGKSHCTGYGYDTYIKCLKGIFGQVRGIMNPRARLIIEAGNIRIEGKIIPLAWDIADAVSEILYFEGERVLKWDKLNYGFDHTYCLVFSRGR